jgi:DNA-binding CsgD family transcriptional regulator
MAERSSSLRSSKQRRIAEELRSGFAGDPESARRCALSIVRDYCDAQASMWFEFGSVGGLSLPSRWICDGTPDAPMREWARSRISWTHASPRRPERSWIGSFRTTRQWTPNLERDYYPTRFYSEIVAPQRISDQLRMLVYHRGTFVAWLGAFRYQGEPDFDRRDQRRIGALASRLADALITAKATERASGVEESCDLLLLPSGRIEFASAAGKAWAVPAGVRAALVAWARKVERGEPEEPVLFGMRVSWSRLEGRGGVRYLLHLEPVKPPELEPTTELSPTQRRVAELALAGLTSGEIGEALAMTSATVRTHLKAIYERLGVSNRAELARALSSASEGTA